jgi:cell division protein FtsQ
MQQVSGQSQKADKSTIRHDPAPSRWSYRLHRLWLTPVFRKFVRVGVPFAVALVGGLIYFGNEARRDAILLTIADMRAEIHSRPEFMVGLMAVDGASERTNEDIRAVVPVDFPISSFDLDLVQIRNDVMKLAAVKDASVRIRDGGALQIDVVERKPVALWRNEGGLDVIDADGVNLGPVAHRSEYAGLPLVAGDGAESDIGEAMQLFAAAEPLRSRLRGLVRIGERRWDVVLDRGQRILLPEQRPVQALERVIALSGAQDMLARDIAAVDVRLNRRPTIRMNKAAVENWWRIRETSVGNN